MSTLTLHFGGSDKFCNLSRASNFGYASQCSQYWSPHMSFILKGSQIVAFQLKGRFNSKTSIQEYKNETQKSY